MVSVIRETFGRGQEHHPRASRRLRLHPQPPVVVAVAEQEVGRSQHAPLPGPKSVALHLRAEENGTTARATQTVRCLLHPGQGLHGRIWTGMGRGPPGLRGSCSPLPPPSCGCLLHALVLRQELAGDEQDGGGNEDPGHQAQDGVDAGPEVGADEAEATGHVRDGAAVGIAADPGSPVATAAGGHEATREHVVSGGLGDRRRLPRGHRGWR